MFCIPLDTTMGRPDTNRRTTACQTLRPTWTTGEMQYSPFLLVNYMNIQAYFIYFFPILKLIFKYSWMHLFCLYWFLFYKIYYLLMSFNIQLLMELHSWNISPMRRVTLTFLGSLLQIGEVVGVSWAHFKERNIKLMEELHCHLETKTTYMLKLQPDQNHIEAILFYFTSSIPDAVKQMSTSSAYFCSSLYCSWLNSRWRLWSP